MVIVDLPAESWSDGKPIHYSMDNWLYNRIIKGKDVLRNDEDIVIAIDGPERAGKSTFAMHVAKTADPSFCVDRVCMNAVQFREAIIKAEKGQAVVYDEAFNGLSSRGALSEVNKLLVELMQEMGQKNLFVIIVLPAFFLLDKYAAIWRTRALIHVYRKSNKRGFWLYFSKKEKKALYLHGKADYSYRNKKIPLVKRRGRFYDQAVIDRGAYLKKKASSFNDKSRKTRAEVYKSQRDKLIFCLHDKFGLSIRQLESVLNSYDVGLKKSMVSNILKEVILEKDLRKEKDDS